MPESTKNHFDIIIVGAGAMGASTAWQLASRDCRVLLIDRHLPPHDRGSSHGETRVIREAYFEHPSYVPLVQRAYELWRLLEQETEASLLQCTGGLMIGPEGGTVFPGALQSALSHGLTHEVLSASDVSSRYPGLSVPRGQRAVLEPRAGMLAVDDCIRAFHGAAVRRGAKVLCDDPVLTWSMNGQGIVLRTARESFRAEKLVIAAGAWLPRLVPELAGKLQVERQVMHWFQPLKDRHRFLPANFPVNLWELESGRAFYALPDAGNGVKAALHHHGETTTPEDVQRTVTDAEQSAMGRLLSERLPGLAPLPHRSTVCLYTNTPDGHFLIDWHPEHSRVLLLSPCSGHGFKFASVVGEVAAELLTDGHSRQDLSLFRADRLFC
ncbi:MAG TPA: N-methyl-L-tryptophan oxidase [Verrucomicrobiales bacterium]|nr:N-methyl-L-tryptophan oxidase [Verrucomicrobiales bacterium]